MARGGKSNKGGPAPQSPGGGHPSGHNSGTVQQLDDEQRHVLTVQHSQKRATLVAAEKAAKAARMNFDKIIKADLGEHGLDDIKDLEFYSTPEGEAALQDELERKLKVARWAGLQIGTQGSLFDADTRPLDERAEDEGYRAGMRGDQAKVPPVYAPGTDAHSKYLEGWHRGQAALAGTIKRTKSDDPGLIRGKGNEPPKPDDFDGDNDGWPDERQVEQRRQQAEGGGEQPAPAPSEAAAESEPETAN